MLLHLPKCLCNTLITEWMDLTDLGKLDASYTNWLCRAKFLSVLSDLKHVRFDVRNVSQLTLIGLRSIKMTSMLITAGVLSISGHALSKINTSMLKSVSIDNIDYSQVSQAAEDFLMSCHCLESLSYNTFGKWLGIILKLGFKHVLNKFRINAVSSTAHYFQCLTVLDMYVEVDEHQLSEILRVNPQLRTIKCCGVMKLLLCFYHSQIVNVTLRTNDLLSANEIEQLLMNQPKLSCIEVMTKEYGITPDTAAFSLFVNKYNNDKAECCDMTRLLKYVEQVSLLTVSGTVPSTLWQQLVEFKETLTCLNLTHINDYENIKLVLSQLSHLTHFLHNSDINISTLVCQYCTNLTTLRILGASICYAEFVEIVHACRKLHSVYIHLSISEFSEEMTSIPKQAAHISLCSLKLNNTDKPLTFRFGMQIQSTL